MTRKVLNFNYDVQNFILYFFVFVLMGWSLLLNALRPFQIYCAPPNLSIRT